MIASLSRAALCLMLLALFAFIVIRTLSRAYASEDLFARFAASGLAILFGIQASINMAVNLHLMPAKGMTLPFISYGGSSMVSLAYGVGMMLALTRLRLRCRRLGIARLGAGPKGVAATFRAGRPKIVGQGFSWKDDCLLLQRAAKNKNERLSAAAALLDTVERTISPAMTA